MRKSDIKEVPEYYAYYIHLNDDVELSEAFEQSIRQIDRVDMEQLKRIGTQTYAEGKWSIHQIIQHVCDWERIWCYRTLVNVRREGNVPVGLDHNLMAGNSNADELPIDQLLGELRAVRLATCAMFQSGNSTIRLCIQRQPHAGFGNGIQHNRPPASSFQYYQGEIFASGRKISPLL